MRHKLIFKAKVGSQAQGTATPQSDEDFKGVYIQNSDEILTFDYEPFIQVNKDECYYELNKFVEMLMEANPNAIELLFTPDDCIIETSPQFELLRKHKEIFLTKRCYATFAGYATTQIKKAKGLNKKMNWETQRFERKTPIDFCFIHKDGKTMPLEVFLNVFSLNQENFGLVKLNHFENCYGVYYDYDGDQNFKGIIHENSNELRLTSISKEFADTYVNDVYTLYYNKDGYSTHCKDYKSYQTWLKERNENRYHTNKSHGQIYDSKNLSHCRRLIDVAIEIGKTGTFTVRRPNVDYLLEIKRGDIPLDDIIRDAEYDIADLPNIYENSNLPEIVDKNEVKKLLISLRKM